MREIILDTETTGLKPEHGHRVIEIGCVEVIYRKPTGNVFHCYINPERDVPAEASAISGLTSDFLKPFPLFVSITDDFLKFVGESRLVIHNASFDIAFLNSELKRIGKPLFNLEEAVDTLRMARRQFPGSPASLDALCKRFQIDLSERQKHGALIDAQLLAKVYIGLSGGNQRRLFQNKDSQDGGGYSGDKARDILHLYKNRSPRPIRSQTVSSREAEAHEQLVNTIKNPVWYREK